MKTDNDLRAEFASRFINDLDFTSKSKTARIAISDWWLAQREKDRKELIEKVKKMMVSESHTLVSSDTLTDRGVGFNQALDAILALLNNQS